jgi:hypothetical protein
MANIFTLDSNEHYFLSRNRALPEDSHSLRGSTRDMWTVNVTKWAHFRFQCSMGGDLIHRNCVHTHGRKCHTLSHEYRSQICFSDVIIFTARGTVCKNEINTQLKVLLTNEQLLNRTNIDIFRLLCGNQLITNFYSRGRHITPFLVKIRTIPAITYMYLHFLVTCWRPLQ